MKEGKHQKSSSEPEVLEIPVPLFGMFLEIWLGDSRDIAKWAKDEFGADVSDLEQDELDADGLTIDLGQGGVDGYIIVYLKDFKERLRKDMKHAVGTLAHECLHATKSVLESRGVPFTPENEELIAYLQEDMIENVLAKLKKRRIKDAK